ncbi:MAG: hypothetical protein AAF310_02335, partial [Myxococcota bacterium]
PYPAVYCRLVLTIVAHLPSVNCLIKSSLSSNHRKNYYAFFIMSWQVLTREASRVAAMKK